MYFFLSYQYLFESVQNLIVQIQVYSFNLIPNYHIWNGSVYQNWIKLLLIVFNVLMIHYMVYIIYNGFVPVVLMKIRCICTCTLLIWYLIYRYVLPFSLQIISCSGDGKIYYTDVDTSSRNNLFDCHFGTTYEVFVCSWSISNSSKTIFLKQW